MPKLNSVVCENLTFIISTFAEECLLVSLDGQIDLALLIIDARQISMDN
jgi:hypothetical protein